MRRLTLILLGSMCALACTQSPALSLEISAAPDVPALTSVRITVAQGTELLAEEQFALGGKSLPQTVAIGSRGKTEGDVLISVQGRVDDGYVAAGTATGTLSRSRPAPRVSAVLGRTCSGPGCTPCTPLTCAAASADCGLLGDGCGGWLACGDCATGLFCGQGNRCGSTPCAPRTCASAGAVCGKISTGCGGELACGSCGAGESCTPTNTCAPGSCTPSDCPDAGGVCGLVDVGCNQFRSCGSCTFPEVCHHGGVTNRCGCDRDAFGNCQRWKANGTRCDAGSECESGSCADGYCCNTPCNGPCDRCDLPGAAGTCAFVDAGTPSSCHPYVCSGRAGSCPTSCDGGQGCADGGYCTPGGACAPLKSAGEACVSSTECTTARCRDDVCCQWSLDCYGYCSSCDLSPPGTCVPADAGTLRTSCKGEACSGVSVHCPIAALTDSFDAGTQLAGWQITPAPNDARLTTVQKVNGRLEIGFPYGGNPDGGTVSVDLATSDSYDFTEGRLHVELANFSSQLPLPQAQLYFWCSPTMDRVWMVLRSGRIYGYYQRNDGSPPVSVGGSTGYSASSRFWRIRASGKMLYWETSSSPLYGFNVLGSAAPGFPLNDVRPGLFTSVTGEGQGAGSLYWDNVNIGP